ncbi:hypothetical protein [Fuerstiella marisgermanici]|uniref:Uncharacterized protein n=1 Tax=Fuerstiella marisgermanici TaxID=1891926 RepID=A0A1P8WFA2_9PLAN|nr:hypothetical protein [Fuerstiella marisgermanici]APZ92754.1 hypothetical protein Fuma_02366 [Fuerstiella marisgermanici]
MKLLLMSLMVVGCLGCGGAGEVERPENPSPLPDRSALSTADEGGGEQSGTLTVE